MFNRCHYVPVVKWKRGEYSALQGLAATLKGSLTPLVDVFQQAEYDPDPIRGCDMAFDNRISRTAQQMEASWGKDHNMFVDLGLVDTNARVQGVIHPLTAVFDDARSRGVQLVPVTGLGRDPAYQAAVRHAAQIDGRGICLRLVVDDFDRGDISAEVTTVLAEVEAPVSDTDLVLDFGVVQGWSAGLLARQMAAAVGAIPTPHQWRTLTVASGAFPESLSGLGVGTHLVSRIDWEAYRQLLAAPLERFPTFGDYTIIHPALADLDPTVINPSASVRYTVDQNWLVIRGQGVRTRGVGGFAQFRSHADTLVLRQEYCGPSFSTGDQEISDIAARIASQGNLETWVRIGVNHHITFAARQIATLCAS